MIVVDKLGLALLLMTIYKQGLHEVDWTLERGELFKFEDNPVVRACVRIWRLSEGENISMSATDQFLFNLIDLDDHDAFFMLEHLESEQRAWREEVKQKYGLLDTETAHRVTNKGDI
jgi:hypothetical protein